MIFKFGHIHCDAHPGNILIRKDPNDPVLPFYFIGKDQKHPQLLLLDHGFYREITPEFRYKYSALWKSLIEFDYDETKKISQELGIGEYYKYYFLKILNRIQILTIDSDVQNHGKQKKDRRKIH